MKVLSRMRRARVCSSGDLSACFSTVTQGMRHGSPNEYVVVFGIEVDGSLDFSLDLTQEVANAAAEVVSLIVDEIIDQVDL